MIHDDFDTQIQCEELFNEAEAWCGLSTEELEMIEEDNKYTEIDAYIDEMYDELEDDDADDDADEDDADEYEEYDEPTANEYDEYDEYDEPTANEYDEDMYTEMDALARADMSCDDMHEMQSQYDDDRDGDFYSS